MKNKFMILSLLLAGTCANVNAQENTYTEKWTDNIFVGGGVGVMSIFNDGMNDPTFNFNISVGKFITPTWGVRAQVGGLWQKLDDANDTKKFGEFNLDAMLNLTNLLGGYNPDRALDVYAFAGPTMNLGKAIDGSINTSVDAQGNVTTTNNYDAHGMKARFGATAGLGLSYDINNKWAINLEGRVGVTPSIYGDQSDCRKAEATGRLTIGATYTFGGKKFAKVSDRVIEKEVVKEVVKEVPVEVVKEVNKPVAASEVAIFFKINKAKISPEGMVNIKLMAKAMKANPEQKYQIAGFADKATGPANYNQKLSEKRAQAVYDALVAEGVNERQLIKVANGGTDNMFGKNYLNRVVILEAK